MTSHSLILIPLLLAATAPPQLFEAVEPHMGTLVSIKLYARNQTQAAQAFQAAFSRIHELDEILSDYKPNSELNRLTRESPDHPIPVSPDLFRILDAAQTIAEDSDGAFDITLGPLTHLWREARKLGRAPDPPAVASSLQRCGFRKLHLDTAAHTVRLDRPDMQLDAGGIAKGYAADAALEVITKLGIASALVAASGDLAFSDPPPGQRGWKIRLDTSGAIVELAHAAVSTSGDAEQHLESNGKRYSHILDPATGIGLTRDIRVTIVAPRGILADGLSTAVSVVGSDRGLRLAARYPAVSATILESSQLHSLRLH